MKRSQILLEILTFGLIVAITAVAQAAEPTSETKKAITAIEKFGGTVTFEEPFADKPAFTVDFKGTQAPDDVLRYLRHISPLGWLDLARSRVTDAGLEHLKGLRDLRELNLTDTKISDNGLASLNGLPALECLVLCRTQVTDTGLKLLKELPRLEWLDLAQTRIGDAGMQHLSQLANLKVLQLGGTRITDAGFQLLSTLPQLDELYLDRTLVTDAGLKQLKRFRRLRILSLAETGISDAGLKHLTDVTTLEQVFVWGAKTTADGIEDVQQAVPLCHIERGRTPDPQPVVPKPDAAAKEDDDSAKVEDAQPAADLHALIRTLQADKDPAKRRDAALAIAELQWDVPKEAIEPLAAAIRHDKEEMVRAAAIDVLLFHGNTGQMPWLVLVDALHDTSARVRVRAAVAIDRKLGGHEEDEASEWTKQPLLVSAAQDKDQTTRALVALAVGKRSSDRKAALPVLLAALRTEFGDTNRY